MSIWWSEGEKKWGPFMYHKSAHQETRFEISLRANDREENTLPCMLLVRVGRYTFIVKLPQIIQPEKKKIIAKYWNAETIERHGRNWYYEEISRKYGISLYDDHFCVYYGRVTDDSETEQYWGTFVPWMTTRHVRHSFYDTDGKLVGELFGYAPYEKQKELEDNTPNVKFTLVDFDNEVITATTRIEEREWRRGAGWFKWISIFYKPTIHRYLDISFDKEVGREKGSWKGGTMGHSIELLPDELHIAGMQKYCEKYNLRHSRSLFFQTQMMLERRKQKRLDTSQ